MWYVCRMEPNINWYWVGSFSKMRSRVLALPIISSFFNKWDAALSAHSLPAYPVPPQGRIWKFFCEPTVGVCLKTVKNMSMAMREICKSLSSSMISMVPSTWKVSEWTIRVSGPCSTMDFCFPFSEECSRHGMER